MTATPEYLQSVLGNLPGVDVNDPALQAAIQSVAGTAPAEGEAKKKDDDADMDDSK